MTLEETIDAFEMVRVEPGVFKMGTGGLAHQVTLTRPFMLSRVQFTQGMFHRFLGTPGCNPNDRRPVVFRSRREIDDIVSALDRLHAPRGWRMALPTEAQWEYAAQGGHMRSEYTRFSGSDKACDVGWFGMGFPDGSRTDLRNLHVVGQKRPNELDLYDMTGNVWELCSNCLYDYGKLKETGATDPSGGKSGPRVCRGGSWFSLAWRCENTARFPIPDDISASVLGFRLAMMQE